jgi:hypothetical protein
MLNVLSGTSREVAQLTIAVLVPIDNGNLHGFIAGILQSRGHTVSQGFRSKDLQCVLSVSELHVDVGDL